MCGILWAHGDNGVGDPSLLLPNASSRASGRPVGALDPVLLESVKMQSFVLDLCPGGLKVKDVAAAACLTGGLKGGSSVLEAPVLCSYQ